VVPPSGAFRFVSCLPTYLPRPTPSSRPPSLPGRSRCSSSPSALRFLGRTAGRNKNGSPPLCPTDRAHMLELTHRAHAALECDDRVASRRRPSEERRRHSQWGAVPNSPPAAASDDRQATSQGGPPMPTDRLHLHTHEVNRRTDGSGRRPPLSAHWQQLRRREQRRSQRRCGLALHAHSATRSVHTKTRACVVCFTEPLLDQRACEWGRSLRRSELTVAALLCPCVPLPVPPLPMSRG
jgi:hypothetical protein